MPTATSQPGRDIQFVLTLKKGGVVLPINEPNNILIIAYINNERELARWIRTASNALPSCMPFASVDNVLGKVTIKLPAAKTSSPDCDNATVYVDVIAQYDNGGVPLTIGLLNGERVELVKLTSAANKQIPKLY